ncbi:MAG: radical SAM protein [Pseudodesulfovibrio sp.]|nr:radical SAM protein [Pseudodesulfovibrio sp.]
MYCRMARGVYLRANGELNCYCSTGEQIHLGHLDQDPMDWDFVKDIYLGHKFSRLRDRISHDSLPFPRHCIKCNYLVPDSPHGVEKVNKSIEWMHIESSALCNLKCPFCVHGVSSSKRVMRPKPHFLPRTLYLKMLDDIKRAGLGIEWMYFSGRGEPTLHPETWKMVEDAKQRFDTNFLMNTNGNVAFDPLIVESGLDKIKIAFDSLDQETYAKYRVGGNVETLLRLTDDIVAYKQKSGSKTPTVIWQKVLFDFNSSPEEIAHFQQVALDHGVDRLRLFFTGTKGFGTHSADDYDLFFPDIEIHNPFKRGFVSAEELDKARESAVLSGSIPGLIKVLNDYMHWAEFGMEDRIDYDRFATLSLCSPELYALRQHEEDGPGRLSVYCVALKNLADLYDQKGHSVEAAQFNALFRRIRV